MRSDSLLRLWRCINQLLTYVQKCWPQINIVCLLAVIVMVCGHHFFVAVIAVAAIVFGRHSIGSMQ